jgi:hypothetical protein
MKNYFIIGLSIVIAILLIFKGCGNEPIDNSHLFNKLDTYKTELNDLKALNDSLVISYQKKKKVKDSIVINVKTKYITVYDTVTNDTADCLPKPYVDTLINIYEDLLTNCDSLNSTKNNMIDNLEAQNNIKDTIIINKDKEIKKQKRKKFGAFLKGLGLGLVGGLFY